MNLSYDTDKRQGKPTLNVLILVVLVYDVVNSNSV